MTIVVTPFDRTDSLFGKKFTLHVNDFITPTKGKCGFNDALALARKTTAVGPWFFIYSSVNSGARIDARGDHRGSLTALSRGHGLTMVVAGVA